MQARGHLLTLLLTLLLVTGVAGAQGQVDLSGSYLEPQNGFVITLQQNLGQLSGDIQGMPLNFTNQDGATATASFWLQGELAGITLQLQPDNNALYVWLYGLDGAGQPVAGSVEAYAAYRNQTPAQGPAAAMGPQQAPGGQGEPWASPQEAAGRLHGNWLAVTQLWPGQLAWRAITYAPDNSFRSAWYVDGQVATWSAGTYTASNGVVVTHVLERSPQLCLFGSCIANVAAEPDGFNRIVFIDENNLLFAEQDPIVGVVQVHWVRQESGLQPQVTVLPVPAGSGQPVAGGGNPGAYLGGNPGAYLGGNPGAYLGGPTGAGSVGGTGGIDSSGFIQGVIRGEGSYVDPNTGGSYDLPLVGDPNSQLYGPGGEELVYNPISGGWTAIDAAGFETELEEGW